MTPTEALRDALGYSGLIPRLRDYAGHVPSMLPEQDQGRDIATEWAEAVMSYLPPGWHLTNDQHAADGLALAALREALSVHSSGHRYIDVHWYDRAESGCVVVASVYDEHGPAQEWRRTGPTIEAAADAAREAL